MPLEEQLVFVIIYLFNQGQFVANKLYDNFTPQQKYKILLETLDSREISSSEVWDKTLNEYFHVINVFESKPFYEALESSNTSVIRFSHPSYASAVSKFLSEKTEILESIFNHVSDFVSSDVGSSFAYDTVWLIRGWHRDRPTKEGEVLNSYLATNNGQLLNQLY